MIHLVISSFGRNDSEHRTEIDSAWRTPEGAEARVKQIESEMKRLNAIPMPSRDERGYLEKLSAWRELIGDADGHNDSWVQEMQVQ